MNQNRTIVVGDIHGCLHEFEQLLEKVKFQKGRDRLVLLGDLINKGPDSLGVLKKVKSLNCEVILGNHEWGFLQSYLGHRKHSQYFDKLVAQMDKDVDEWANWFATFPKYIEEDKWIFVHGGIIPDVKLKDSPESILTRIRTWDGSGDCLYSKDDPPWYDFYKGEKLVVFGHWASKGLVVKESVVGLDTGCVYGRKLSCLILPEKKIVQVDAKGNYEEIIPL